MFEELVDDVPWLVVFEISAVIVLLVTAVLLAFYIREQSAFLGCIENGGIWLNNYQIGCTYPHG